MRTLSLLFGADFVADSTALPARSLAELQNGMLTYRAREDGGSVFTLQLPAANADVERELP